MQLFAASLFLFVIFSSFDPGAGDVAANCKAKVLSMSLKHCLNDGVRLKRDTLDVDSKDDTSVPETPPRASDQRRQISPKAASALAGMAGPIISQMLLGNTGDSRGQEIPNPWDQGYAGVPRRPMSSFPGYQGFGFQPPASGDDLFMGLSSSDMEDLYIEMMDRLPRAAKNKDQTMRMITAYAASCCNEKLGADTCSDSANIVDCP